MLRNKNTLIYDRLSFFCYVIILQLHFVCVEEKMVVDKPGMTANLREKMGSGAQMISRLPNTLKDVMTIPRQEPTNTIQQSSNNSYINAVIEVRFFSFLYVFCDFEIKDISANVEGIDKRNL